MRGIPSEFCCGTRGRLEKDATLQTRSLSGGFWCDIDRTLTDTRRAIAAIGGLVPVNRTSSTHDQPLVQECWISLDTGSV